MREVKKTSDFINNGSKYRSLIVSEMIRHIEDETIFIDSKIIIVLNCKSCF